MARAGAIRDGRARANAVRLSGIRRKGAAAGALRLLAAGSGGRFARNLRAGKAPITIPCFSLVYVIDLWEYALNTGEPVEDGLFETAARILDAFLPRLDESGCVCRFPEREYWNFYEWQPGLSGEIGAEDKDARAEAPLTAWYALALDAMRRLCEYRGVDGSAYARRFESARSALERFWSEERGGYLLYDAPDAPMAELTQALALLAGGISDARAARLRVGLVSGVWIPVTLTTLCSNTKPFYRTRPTNRGYFPTLRVKGCDGVSGATSVWETSLGAEDFHRAGSLCHGWSTVPVLTYFRVWSPPEN